jgi:hypothetical protein
VRRAVLIAIASALLLGHASARAAAPPLELPSEVTPADRERLEAIARKSFASTRVEQPPYAGQPEIWEYLLDHPEFASHVTRALKLARYRIWRDDSGFRLDDGWGVKGQFTVVYAGNGRRVMYARGHFEQRLLPDIQGQAVATLEYAFRPGAGSQAEIATSASGYVQVDNKLLNALGKLAAPIVQAKADREAGLLLRTFARVTRAIDERPAEVYRLVSERPDVPRRELAEFHQLLRLP